MSPTVPKMVAAPIGPIPRMSHRLVPEAATAVAETDGSLSFANVHDLVAGDFNGDGVIDVAMSTEIDNGTWSYTGVVIITGIPDSPQIPGDIDGDGTVGIVDFLLLLAAWGPCDEPCPPSCSADLDGDCNVGITDFLALLANWS